MGVKRSRESRVDYTNNQEEDKQESNISSMISELVFKVKSRYIVLAQMRSQGYL